jgi:hypothetical protein
MGEDASRPPPCGRRPSWVWLAFLVIGAVSLRVAINADLAIHAKEGWIDGRRLHRPAFEKPEPADNAFDTYQEAIALIADTREADTEAFDALRRGAVPPEALAPTLARYEPAFAKLHEAAGKPYVSPSEPTPEYELPYLARLRHRARALAAKVRVEHARGRDAEALGAARDGYAMALSCPRYGGLIEMLVGLASGAIVQDATRGVLPEATVARDELLAHARWVREARGRLWPLSATLNRESRLGDTCFARTATGDNPLQALEDEPPSLGDRIDWRLTASAYDSDAALLWWDDRWARFLEVADRPYFDRALDGLAARTEPDLDARNDWISRVLIADPAPAREKWLMLAGSLAAEETLAALRAFELEHGRRAATLDELVPDYLPEAPEAPEDPYAAGPLRYALVGGDFLLYSVGPNERDDGGSEAKVEVERLKRPGRDSVRRADIVYADTRVAAACPPGTGVGAPAARGQAP